jgi:hypothetical protein
MNNRPNNLRQARTDHSVTWTTFIQAFDKDASRLFCFFEGPEDEEYYGVRIGTMIPGDGKKFPCGGKDNVLKLYRLIVGNQKYQLAWVALFIDKDFDDPQQLPKDDRMYVTPVYAIENFYVSPTCFRRILRARFKLTTVNSSDSEEACEEIVELYKQRLEEFNDVTEELNAWMYLQRLEEEKQKLKKEVKFNKIDPKLCFDVQLDKVEKKYTLDYLTQVVSDSYPLDPKEIVEQAQQFHKMDRTALFRGKDMIEFLKQFIKRLQNEPRPSFLLTVDHNLTFSKDNITADLSQYADTPECLNLFLSSLAKKRPTLPSS